MNIYFIEHLECRQVLLFCVVCVFCAEKEQVRERKLRL